MNRQKHFLILLLLLPSISFSQQTVTLSSVDSLATTVKYKKDLSALTKELTNPYSEQLLKRGQLRFKVITSKWVCTKCYL